MRTKEEIFKAMREEMLNIPQKPLFLILRVMHSTVYLAQTLIRRTKKKNLKNERWTKYF
jgi:hypothetical protein